MYKIIGREKLGKNRYGRYIVEYSIPWPEKARHVYLASPYTSYFPGRIKLTKEKDRAKTVIKLYEGIYPYYYIVDSRKPLLDSENPYKVVVRLFPDKQYEFTASLSIIGLSEYSEAVREKTLRPDLIIHNEDDPAFIHKYMGYTIVRIYVPREVLEKVCLATIVDGQEEILCSGKLFSNNYIDYYQFILDKEYTSLNYYFILYTRNRQYYFGKNGLGDKTPIIKNNIPGIEEPQWFIGTIYYQIFPDSFSRSSKEFTVEEYMSTRERKVLGGDLRGILNRLDYIEELGVEALYLTPIYRASSYHRYDVIDHKTIDRVLGNTNEFIELVRKAHEREIKIILDLVVHHSSPCSKEFRTAIKKGTRSSYWRWYLFLVDNISSLDERVYKGINKYLKNECREIPSELVGQEPFYESYFGLWQMPKYNHYNAEVINFFKNIMKYWFVLEVDGFRVDVGLGVPDQFNKELYSFSRKHNKLYMLEIIHGLQYYRLGEIADTAMNYYFRNNIVKLVLTKEIELEKFIEEIYQLYYRLPIYIANSLYTLLSSHDTARIKTVVKNYSSEKVGDVLKLLYTILFIIYGSPAIYYGDEIGLEGGDDPECRKPMIWNEEFWDKTLLTYIKELISLRKKYRVLRYGFTKLAIVADKVLSIKRFFGEEEVVGLFNIGLDQIKILYEYKNYKVLLKEKTRVYGDKIVFEPYGFIVFSKQ